MFYYYGSKRRMAKLYPLPRYRTVVEPFAGSASYGVFQLMSRHADRLVLIEKDPRVADLWERLLAMTPEEIRSIPIPEPGTKTDDFLIMTAATSNAIARCKSMTVTDRMRRITRGMLISIAEAVPVVAGKVEIIRGSYEDAPEIEATWFVDPPYQTRESDRLTAKTSYPKGLGYAAGCDSSSLDFGALGEWCASRPGQVIVAEQRGADWLPFVPLVRIGDSQGVARTEVIWERDADPPLVLFGDAQC